MFFSSMPSTSRRPGAKWKILLGLVILVLLVAACAWYKLWRQVPQQFASEEDLFKYGSIGTEDENGIPYWIWLTLPRIFPEHLPARGGGYAALGVVWEDGHETPIGFSKKTIGFPRIGINCAVCHSGSYRTDPDGPTIAVPAAPAQKFDAQGYQQFLMACATDPKYSSDTIMEQISYSVELSFCDKLLYRYVLIPATKKALLEQKELYSWMDSRPPWGCGRIDPFNPVKFNQLGISPAGDSTVGNSDMEPIWNMAKHEGFALHWDGLNTSLTEVVLSGAIGDGATKKSLPVRPLKILEDWLKRLPPPAYPFLDSIDQELATRGEKIFEKKCAECHAFGGKRTGQVIPVQEVGTDRYRLEMWTEEAAKIYNEYAAGYSWDFNDFRKTNGYASVALDGIWLRAPYLHNGSVPTLEDLLKPAAERPTEFYRGYDVYSRDQMGFIHQGPEAEKYGFHYRTGVPAMDKDLSIPRGNSNQGHEGEAYGTELPDEDKAALIEYMKRL